MNEFLLTLLSLSISGGILAGFCFLLKPLLKKNLSKTWQYYLWLIVAARLLLPFVSETNLIGALFQQFSLPPVQQEAILSGERQDKPSVSPGQAPTGGELIEKPSDNSRLDSALAHLEGMSGFSLKQALAAIWQNLWLLWAMVAAALLLKKVTSYRSFLRFVKAGCKETEDSDLLDLYLTAAEEMRVHRLPKLFFNPVIGTPIQVGVLQPMIVLPENLDRNDLLYIFRHELVHSRRMEFLYKWLIQIILCIHWFNPLVYLLAREVDRACELACDEAVLHSLNREEQKTYGTVLLSAAERAGSYSSEVISVTLCEDGKNLKERLGGILDFQTGGKSRRILGVALTVLLCLGAGMLGGYTAARVALGNIAVPSALTSGAVITPQGETRGGFGNGRGHRRWAAWSSSSASSYSLENVDTVSLDMNGANVQLLPIVGEELRVEYSGGVLPLVETADGKLRISSGGEIAGNMHSAELFIYLPQTYQRVLDITGVISSFEIDGLLRLERLNLNLSASSADFSQLQIGVCELLLEASSLEVDQLSGAGLLQANASDVELGAVTLTGDLQLNGTASSMGVEMTRGSSFEFQGDLNMGTMEAYFPLEGHREAAMGSISGTVSAIVNEGGRLIAVENALGEFVMTEQENHHE